MTFNFTNATTIIKKLSRSAFGWLFTRKNKVHYQENPSGGMFGQLVSRDETHRP